MLQGNNFFACEEHVRCCETIEDFIKINNLNNIKFAGKLDCIQFTRFMMIGNKL